MFSLSRILFRELPVAGFDEDQASGDNESDEDVEQLVLDPDHVCLLLRSVLLSLIRSQTISCESHSCGFMIIVYLTDICVSSTVSFYSPAHSFHTSQPLT